MPILTTLRMRLPVCPFQAPDRTRVAKSRHARQHRVHVGHDVTPVDLDHRVGRRAQRRMQHGAILGDVDLVAAEHGVALGRQAALLRKLCQQRNGLWRDAVLRIVEHEPAALDRETRGAAGILGEQRAQRHILDLCVVRGKRPPRGAGSQRRLGRFAAHS